MNKVIFVCFLTLSVCFSKPAANDQDVTKLQLLQSDVTPNPKNLEETKPPTTPVTSPSNDTGVSAIPKLNTTTEQTNLTVIDANSKKIETKTESVVTPKVTDIPVDNKTVNKSTESSTEKKADTKEADAKKVDTKEADAKKVDTKEADTKSDAKGADNKDKNDKASTAHTTAGTPAPKPTTSPAEDTGKHAIVQSRSFDGASFIGGIILTLGLLAIGFMGFKYYKNQTERNYHTL